MSRTHEEDVLVSIIMPTYNDESHIQNSLVCLKEQSYTNIEVLIVDDGSTDKTSSLVKDLACQDKRFTYIYQENSGAGVARNHGMHSARGKYLLFLDSDDLFERDLVLTLVHKAESTQAEVVICNADMFFENGNSVDNSLVVDLPQEGVYTREQFSHYVFSCNGAAWNKLFRRDFIQANGIEFQSLHHSNDTFFTYVALAMAQSVAVTHSILIHYRVGQGTSLRDKSFSYPLCDIKSLSAVGEKLTSEGLLIDSLQSDFDTFAIRLILSELIRYAANNSQTAIEMYEAFFQDFIPRFGLADAKYPRIHSRQLVLKYRLVAHAGSKGLIWACKGGERFNVIERSSIQKIILFTRLFFAPLVIKKES